jgi:membrane fusion protein (multidrug efflux system)
MKKSMTVKTVAALLLLGGIFTICCMLGNGSAVRTDDAQIEQYITPVNVRVAGYIKEIRFIENQHVNKGDTLMLIDDRDLRIALAQAEASLIDAKSGLKVMAGTVETASNSASAYDASLEEARLREEKLERDYKRYSNLLEKNAATPVQVEQYKTELDVARARVKAIESQRRAAQSTVGEVTQRQENAEAAVKRAQAAVDMAELNLSYTVITAPADGTVGRRTIEEGQLMSPGQTVTTLIPDTRKWVVANFKETQMDKIGIGQKVTLTVDALPGRKFNGTVSSISSATGSKYSMVPTDNSAGNFVKIQQRLPVRIDFDESLSAEDNRRLAAGMMCIVKVDADKNR